MTLFILNVTFAMSCSNVQPTMSWYISASQGRFAYSSYAIANTSMPYQLLACMPYHLFNIGFSSFTIKGFKVLIITPSAGGRHAFLASGAVFGN